jgi:Zn finger protein HypA/HybF involved in hydrogenase expression
VFLASLSCDVAAPKPSNAGEIPQHLSPNETSSQCLGGNSSEKATASSAFEHTVDDVAYELFQLGENSFSTRLLNCKQPMVFVCRKNYYADHPYHPPEEFLGFSACDVLFCEKCHQQRLRKKIIKPIEFVCRHFKNIKFVTVTNPPVKHITKDLYNKRKEMVSAFLLGINCKDAWIRFEIKKSGQPNNPFYLHCHILGVFDYVPQKIMSALWESITKGSRIVDVRKAKNTKHVIAYLTKYLTSESKNAASFNAKEKAEIVHNLKGVRRYYVKGEFSGNKKGSLMKLARLGIIRKQGHYACPKCQSSLKMLGFLYDKHVSDVANKMMATTRTLLDLDYVSSSLDCCEHLPHHEPLMTNSIDENGFSVNTERPQLEACLT